MRSNLFNQLLKDKRYPTFNPSIIGVQEGTVEQCNDILDILNGKYQSRHTETKIDGDSVNDNCNINSNYKMVGQGRSNGNQWGSQVNSWGNEFCCLFYDSDFLDLLDYGTFWLSETPNIPNSKSSLAKYPR